MGFIIKAAFWFTIVLLLLPFTNPQMETRLDSQPQVRIGATIVAATSAFDDLTGICKRRPDVCETGGQTLAALAARARDGAVIAFQFLDKRFAGKSADAVTTATIPSASATQAQAAGTSQASAAEPAVANIPVPMPAPVETAQNTPRISPASRTTLPKPYSPPRP